MIIRNDKYVHVVLLLVLHDAKCSDAGKDAGLISLLPLTDCYC